VGGVTFPSLPRIGILDTYMETTEEDPTPRSLQKGSAEFLVLASLDGRDRHGYELAQLIESRSGGKLKFQAATLYPLLYKLEKRGLVEGRWVEKSGERRRRFYRLTAAGRAALGSQRQAWREFVEAIDLVGRLGRA
jgi:PadR family transcriptional regulator